MKRWSQTLTHNSNIFAFILWGESVLPRHRMGFSVAAFAGAKPCWQPVCPPGTSRGYYIQPDGRRNVSCQRLAGKTPAQGGQTCYTDSDPSGENQHC